MDFCWKKAKNGLHWFSQVLIIQKEKYYLWNNVNQIIICCCSNAQSNDIPEWTEPSLPFEVES